jgi:hypothetical protein
MKAFFQGKTTGRIGLVLSAIQVCFATATATASSDQVTYSDVLNALRSGRDVAAFVQFQRCLAADGTTSGPEIAGGFRVLDFLVPASRYIAISHSHGSITPDGQPVIEYMQYRLSPDGFVEARLSQLDSKEKLLGPSMSYTCSLGDGMVFSF